MGVSPVLPKNPVEVLTAEKRTCREYRMICAAEIQLRAADSLGVRTVTGKKERTEEEPPPSVRDANFN
jgi:hypothetical protein